MLTGDGFDKIIKFFVRWRKEIDDGTKKKLIKDLGNYFLRETNKKWDIRGDGGVRYRDEKWEKLAQATAEKIKVKATGETRGYDHILIDTGQMRGALDMQTRGDEARIFFQGTEAQKYAGHHFGLRVGRGYRVKLPKRVVLNISDEDERDLQEETDKFIKETFKKVKK